MAYIPESNSVVAFQSDPTKLVGTVSIIGTAGASVIGLTPVAVTNKPSISGAVDVSNFPTTQNVSGSVAAWLNSSNASVITVGSPVANQSVSGTVNIGNFPTTQNVSGSVVTFQGGTLITSIVSTVPSSVIVGASIFGLPPVNITNTNLNVGGSVVAFQGAGWSGSVAAVQNGSWSTSIVTGNSSIITVPTGSVITVLQAPSIVGTYARDGAAGATDKGLFVLGIRNDTLASITSADTEYTPFTVGEVGEQVVANSPINNWLTGQTSVMYGSSVTVIAAQGASVFSYITGVQLANFSGSSVLVKFSGATDSVIAWTIAPASSGSNIYYPNPLKTRQNAAFSASISGTASVYLSAQGFTAKE